MINLRESWAPRIATGTALGTVLGTYTGHIIATIVR
jgi:hypothetical protein